LFPNSTFTFPKQMYSSMWSIFTNEAEG
jgi:hypothetical protein